MYDRLPQDRTGANRDTLLWHHGDWRQSYTRHLQECHEVLADRHDRGLLYSRLHGRMCHERFLCRALHQVGSRSSAAGPDGIRPERIIRDPWGWCGQLSEALKSGAYRAGESRLIEVQKPGGRGTRTIHVPNVADRVVARAVVMVLQPLVDPLFSETSFGFRPYRGVLHALSAMRSAIVRDCGTTVVTADIKSAFDKVPSDKVAAILTKQFGSHVADLAMHVAGTGGDIGLRQGSPLSPLLFNFFADEHIDRPWMDANGPTPLLRYADDLAVVANGPDQAEGLHHQLSAMCDAAGTPLKATDQPWSDLAGGAKADWLGYEIGIENGKVSFRLSARRWEHLEWNLLRCHHLVSDSAPQRAEQVIRGWLHSAGPCKAYSDVEAVLNRVRSVGKTCAFDDLPADDELEQWWQDGSEQAAAIFTAQALTRASSTAVTGLEGELPIEDPDADDGRPWDVV